MAMRFMRRRELSVRNSTRPLFYDGSAFGCRKLKGEAVSARPHGSFRILCIAIEFSQPAVKTSDSLPAYVPSEISSWSLKNPKIPKDRRPHREQRRNT